GVNVLKTDKKKFLSAKSAHSTRLRTDFAEWIENKPGKIFVREIRKNHRNCRHPGGWMLETGGWGPAYAKASR
ncbi:MAG: hypothetical protein ACE5IP_08715, partial [Terriglobia bacterium]